MEEVIESNKRGAKLCHAGYMYTKTAVRKNKIWWKCSKRASLNCCASVSTSIDSKNPVPRILHNHEPEEGEVEYAKFRNRMRKGFLEAEEKTKTAVADNVGIINNNNNNNDDAVLQQQLYHVENQKKNSNYNSNSNTRRRNNSKVLLRIRKKANSQKCSAKDLLPNRFHSTILSANGPMRPAPNLMTIQRLNQLSSLKSLGLPNKRLHLSENRQNLFPHLQMNLSNNASAKCQGIKRPAPPPVSMSRGEVGDVKPCKRQLDAQNSIQLEQNHSQATTSRPAYSQMPSTQQTNHSNHGHQSSQMMQNHQSSPIMKQSYSNHLQATVPGHQSSQQNHHSGQQTNLQLPTIHSNHLQPTTPGHQSVQMTQSQQNHQSSQMTQSQQAHSQITIVSQSRHVTTGQLNHKVSISQHDHPKANITAHSNPFQVLTGQQSPQMDPGQKIHQNVTMGQPNPHQVVVDQSMVTDRQSQTQISTGHPKHQHLSPAQLRFPENVPARTNRIEGVSGQQRYETTLQESCKTQPEAADSRLKQSSIADSTYRNAVSKMSLVPQKSKRTFTVPKHQHTVMSSLASLWKESKLCDATIGNGTFKIMVHKVVLLAISPNLLSQANIKANCFIRVNLPEEVSQAALVAFSEYMYHGVLTLNPILLQQLRIIATQLGIRELELLCDTHLLYCDFQNSAVDTDLDLSETCHLPILGSPTNTSTSTDLSQGTIVVPESRTVKQEEVCEEFSLNSSQSLLKDFTLPIKMEPVDPESSTCVQSIFNSSMSPNANSDLNNAKYMQHNLDVPSLFSGQGNEQSFHSIPSDFESSTIPFRQGATDSLLELNDILQLTKFLKKSDLTNFGPTDTFDKSTISLSPDPCVLQNNDVFDHETDYNKMNPSTNTDHLFRQNCGGQSKKHPVVSTSQRTSQPLEVLKETAELLTFQITDVRSVHRTIDIT